MPQTVTISIKDDKNRIGKMSINFADSATLAEIQAWVSEFLAIAEPVTKGGFMSATITSALNIPPERRRIPDVTADVEEKLAAGFRTEGNYRNGCPTSSKMKYKHYLIILQSRICPALCALQINAA